MEILHLKLNVGLKVVALVKIVVAAMTLVDVKITVVAKTVVAVMDIVAVKTVVVARTIVVAKTSVAVKIVAHVMTLACMIEIRECHKRDLIMNFFSPKQI